MNLEQRGGRRNFFKNTAKLAISAGITYVAWSDIGRPNGPHEQKAQEIVGQRNEIAQQLYSRGVVKNTTFMNDEQYNPSLHGMAVVKPNDPQFKEYEDLGGELTGLAIQINQEAPMGNVVGKSRYLVQFFGPVFVLKYAGETIRSIVSKGKDIQERRSTMDEIWREYPLTNSAIWFAIIQKAGKLSLNDIRKIADAMKEYKDAFPDDNPPVAAHLDRAGLTSLLNDNFFLGVSFNYDDGIYPHMNEDGLYVYPSYRDDIKGDLNLIVKNGAIQERESTQQSDLTYIINPERGITLQTLVQTYRRDVVPKLKSNRVIKPYGANNQPPVIVRMNF